jgi:signal transduction histidine kinase
VTAPFVAGALLLRLGYEIRFATLTLVALTTIVVTEAVQTFRLHAGMGRAASLFDSDAAPVQGAASPEERLRDLQLLAGRIATARVADAESRRVLVHELKTPITSLRGLTQLLDGYDLSPSERQRVNELLRSEAGRLQTMVERLLDLERLNVRDFEKDSVPVDLAALATERVELQRGATEHSIDLDVEGATIVRGDSMLLGRVIDNLMINAMKFSPPRSPVSVRVFASDGLAVLEVRDQGSGVPEGEREVIFRRFARGTTSRGTEGLGLGLSLVAEAIAWHRGHVRIDTAPSGGALFRVELPLAPAPEVSA